MCTHFTVFISPDDFLYYNSYLSILLENVFVDLADVQN